LGNFPADGAQSRLINISHHAVLSLSKPANSCSFFGHDGVAMGGRIDCPAGYPADDFTCVVSSFPFGEPTFSIVVQEPGFKVTFNLDSLNLPAGTTFRRIYVWDDDGGSNVNVRVSQMAVAGVAVQPNMHAGLGFDCTGIFAKDCVCSNN
jgi:hypothetical protein